MTRRRTPRSSKRSRRRTASIDAAIKTSLVDAIAELAELLRSWDLHELSRHLEQSSHAPSLVGELLRNWTRPKGLGREVQQRFLRAIGWTDAHRFDGLQPPFWDVAALVPPRDTALKHTLEQLALSERCSSDRILDAGCGTGLLAQIAIRSGFRGQLVGAEIAQSWIDRARRRDLASLTVNKVDITRLADPQSFDAIYCYMVLHHVEQIEQAFECLYNSLKPNGVLVYTDILFDSKDPETGDLLPFPLELPAQEVTLESGQLLHFASAMISGRPHFKPHPDQPSGPPEYFLPWRTAADALSNVGFIIDHVTVLDEVTVSFTCRRPDTRMWEQFGERIPKDVEAIQVLEVLQRGGSGIHDGPAPFQFTLPVMAALWHDLVGEDSGYGKYTRGAWWKKGKAVVNFQPRSPDPFDDKATPIRAIAFFSWEPSSRQFLIRRAYPHRFHLIPYSSVFSPWGSLGRMLDDLKRYGTKVYLERRGYSFLDASDGQRTLPFAADFKILTYNAALAVPVTKAGANDDDADEGVGLIGAYLVYLLDGHLLPVHTNRTYHRELRSRFKEIADLTAQNIDAMHRAYSPPPEIGDREDATAREWMTKVQEKKEPLVIARLTMRIAVTSPTKAPFEDLARGVRLVRQKRPGWRRALNAIAREHNVSCIGSAVGVLGRLAGLAPEPAFDLLCAGVRAMLSGPDCYTVRLKTGVPLGESVLLIAARPHMSYEDLEQRVLGAVAPAAKANWWLSIKCERLE